MVKSKLTSLIKDIFLIHVSHALGWINAFHFKFDKNHGNTEFWIFSWFMGVTGRLWKTSPLLWCLCKHIDSFYLWGLGPKWCIIVSMETNFVLYREYAFYSLTPTLWNFILAIGKTCFWSVSQMTTKLECMRLSIILLWRWFVQVRSIMLAHLGNTKMTKFLPKSSLCFQGVSTVKAMSLLVLMKIMWQVHLI